MIPFAAEQRVAADRTVRLLIAGEIDLAVYDDFVAAIKRAIDTGDARRVEIDLGGVQFLDCRGIHALMDGLDLARRKHIGYTVCNVKGWIRTTMEFLGVLPFLAPTGPTTPMVREPSIPAAKGIAPA